MNKGKKNRGGKKNVAGKKNKGAKKKKNTGKKKAGKDKKPILPPRKKLEIKLTEQMMNRINKKPRPMKVLREMYLKLMEKYDKKHLPRPVCNLRNWGQKPPEPYRPLADKINLERRITMLEKRKGDEDDSPINIDTSIVRKCNYLRLVFEGLFQPERKTTIINSGYHVIGHLGGDVLISSGPLFGKYKLYNFHVHYGETHNDGTEHAINGRRYTLEMHMVFLPLSPNVLLADGSFKMVAKKVVLGLMFKLSDEPSYYDLFSVVTHIDKKGKSLETSNNLLYDFKDVLSTSEYFNYSGSATEGDHNDYEWLLFKKVLPINRTQMQNMWDLRKFDVKKSNVKPIQSIGERSIFTPVYYDHMKCQGQEQCQCYGSTFNPIKKLKIKKNIE